VDSGCAFVPCSVFSGSVVQCSVVQCFGGPVVLWSCGPVFSFQWFSVQCFGGPVVLWSCGPVVLYQLVAAATRLRPAHAGLRLSCGPVVLWSLGPFVPWSFGPVAQLSARRKKLHGRLRPAAPTGVGNWFLWWGRSSRKRAEERCALFAWHVTAAAPPFCTLHFAF